MTRPAGTLPNEILRVRDIELRFIGGRHRPPPSTDDIIYVHKDAAFVASINETLERVRPKRMIEVGVLDGGSTVYWHYQYDLDRLAAFDIAADRLRVNSLLARLLRHEIAPFANRWSGRAPARPAIEAVPV